MQVNCEWFQERTFSIHGHIEYPCHHAWFLLCFIGVAMGWAYLISIVMPMFFAGHSLLGHCPPIGQYVTLVVLNICCCTAFLLFLNDSDINCGYCRRTHKWGEYACFLSWSGHLGDHSVQDFLIREMLQMGHGDIMSQVTFNNVWYTMLNQSWVAPLPNSRFPHHPSFMFLALGINGRMQASKWVQTLISSSLLIVL